MAVAANIPFSRLRLAGIDPVHSLNARGVEPATPGSDTANVLEFCDFDFPERSGILLIFMKTPPIAVVFIVWASCRSPSFAETNYVTSLQDSGPGSLRQLVADSQSGDWIKFRTNGMITLLSGEISVANSINIVGSGATNITVSGDLRGGNLTLTAAAWLNVEATGRIEAAQADASGRITLAADVFVNAGQIHADGASAGQILVQARNVLNAGPMTAS